MNISDKTSLIFRSILIILFIALLAIFYQYSQNGRYTYHKIDDDNYTVLDTHTGIQYGYTSDENNNRFFYILDYKNGKLYNNGHLGHFIPLEEFMGNSKKGASPPLSKGVPK